ncbi:hypothetical protein GCM10027212_35850 [Actinotalea caeni]
MHRPRSRGAGRPVGAALAATITPSRRFSSSQLSHWTFSPDAGPVNGSECDARLLANHDLPAERGLVDVRERRDVVGEDGDALESCPHEPTVAGTRHRRPVSQPRRRYTLKRNSTTSPSAMT